MNTAPTRRIRAQRGGFVVAAILAAVASFSGSNAARADGEHVGVMFDAGFPDGGNASLIWRPIGELRLALGGGTNLISPGIRGGATYVFRGGFSLSVEGGHYFSGDATTLARLVSGNSMLESPALRDVSYDYVNLHVGIELGPPKYKFCIHGGTSYVTGSIKNAAETVNQAVGSGATTFSQDPRLEGWVVSARMGFIVYFF